MITLAKVKDSFIENFKLIIKVLQFGPKTAKQISPFGIDSNPLENYTAVYSETSNAGESVILGYIHKNYITENEVENQLIWVLEHFKIRTKNDLNDKITPYEFWNYAVE